MRARSNAAPRFGRDVYVPLPVFFLPVLAGPVATAVTAAEEVTGLGDRVTAGEVTVRRSVTAAMARDVASYVADPSFAVQLGYRCPMAPMRDAAKMCSPSDQTKASEYAVARDCAVPELGATCSTGMFAIGAAEALVRGKIALVSADRSECSTTQCSTPNVRGNLTA